MVEGIEQIITAVIRYMEASGPALGVFFIILESIFPFLPLAVFIGVNQIVFGSIFGFFISWISTVAGCYLAFMICRLGFSDRFYKKISHNDRLVSLMKRITRIKFSNLVLLMALPFTPAFMFNIAGGLSKMSKQTFMLAVLISKLSIVYFWGYIGGTLVESLTDIRKLIHIAILLLIAYVISIAIDKKFKIK